MEASNEELETELLELRLEVALLRRLVHLFEDVLKSHIKSDVFIDTDSKCDKLTDRVIKLEAKITALDRRRLSR